MAERNEIVLFTDNGIKLEVPITPEQETVWLTQEQMSDCAFFYSLSYRKYF